MTSPSSSPQPSETAKQFLLRAGVFAVAILLLLAGSNLLASLGMVLGVIAVALRAGKQRVTKSIPALWVVFLCFAASVFLNASAKIGDPLALKYRPWYVFALIGGGIFSLILEYRKWHSSRLGNA